MYATGIYMWTSVQSTFIGRALKNMEKVEQMVGEQFSPIIACKKELSVDLWSNSGQPKLAALHTGGAPEPED